LFVEQ